MEHNSFVSGFGSIVVDVLMSSPDLELYRKNSVLGQTLQIGGVIPTALMVLSRLGISTQFHSTVGDDLFGHALRTMLAKEHIDTQNVITVKNKTPFAFVVVNPANGKRTSFYTTGTFSTNVHSFDVSLNPKSTHLLLDGHNSAISLTLLKKAKKQRIVTLLDLGNPKDGIDTLVPYADYIIVPQAYWKIVWPHKSPEKVAANLLDEGPSTVVLTMEERGCLITQKHATFHQPSIAVKAMDTNGAGDVFFGSFVYGLTQGWDLRKTAQFACAAAARSCTIVGKDQKIPHSTQEVFDFLARI